MKTTQSPITVRELRSGFNDRADADVSALGGKPKYARIFIRRINQFDKV